LCTLKTFKKCLKGLTQQRPDKELKDLQRLKSN
jgi:hypothetical protein